MSHGTYHKYNRPIFSELSHVNTLLCLIRSTYSSTSIGKVINDWILYHLKQYHIRSKYRWTTITVISFIGPSAACILSLCSSCTNRKLLNFTTLGHAANKPTEYSSSCQH